MSDKKTLWRGYLAALCTLLTWTGFSLISRLGGRSVLTPYDIIALRLLTASAVLLPLAARRLPPGAWRDGRLWLLALLGNLFYCLVVYRGFRYAPAAHGAILLSGTQPFLLSICVWLLHGTRPTRPRVFGLTLITLGIACAARPYFNDASAQSLVGDLLILSGSIMWAVYSVLATRWAYPPWTLTCAVALGSAAIYLPVYVCWLPKQLAAAPLSMIILQATFQGLVATILSMFAYLKTIALLGTERAAAFLALVPVVTGLVAVPLLGEDLTGWLLGGVVLVSLGSYVASRYAQTRQPTICTAR